MGVDYKKMWEIVEIPVYILISWKIISTILVGMDYLNPTVLTIIGILIYLGAFLYTGYNVKSIGRTVGDSAKNGAFAGVIYGIFAAVLSIISYYYFPQLYTEAINQGASAPGVTREMVEMIIKISVYSGIVWIPIVNGLIGAGLSALGGLANRK